MKWLKLYEDVVGVLISPFIGIAYLIGAIIFLFLGWIPAIFVVFTVRYTERKASSGFSNFLVGISLLWLLMLFGEVVDAEKLLEEIKDSRK